MTTRALPGGTGSNDNIRTHFVATRPDLTASVFQDYARQRQRQLLLLTVLLSFLIGSAFVVFGLVSPILPAVVLLLIATPFFLWHFPRATLYTTLAMTCLIEMIPTGYSDALTDRVPFFWNVNTIFQRYAGANFKALPVSPFELFVALSFVLSVLRSVFSGTAKVKVGPLFAPIVVYLAFVGIGWAHGVATGGDFKLSLQEVRAQFYFGAAYLMALYLAPERKTQRVLLWVFAACAALKGLLYAFRKWVTLAGQPVPDQGVGSHEEAFFFVMFLALLGILALTGTGRGHGLARLHRFLLWVSPVVFLGLVATNRRAGTAAIVIGGALLFVAAVRAFPERRRRVATLAVVLSVLGFGYYTAFKNSQSAIAQPARAVKSHFHPDARDAASNAYRDAENANILHNVRSAPVLGIGYGKRMAIVVPMANIAHIYEWWDLLPHNQIYWVWMRVGSLGFFAFWMMVAAILLRACAVLRRDQGDSPVEREGKQIAIFVLLTLSSLLMFGLLDLQLSNPRDMLFTGIWVGVLATLPTTTALGTRRERTTAPVQGGRA